MFEDKAMKRVHVENWSTKERLALAASVLRSGDQNWMSVSRVIRTLGDPNRSPDWFSQKQCAVQYDLLLNNVGTPKRKKRNEKTNENSVDTPGETIMRKLTQERIDELKMLMTEYRALYLKEKREMEEINMGKLDDKLNDILHKLEHIEKHEDEEQAAFIRHWQEKKQKEAERIALSISSDLPHTPVEVKPTSPLLTSLLQSPSPISLHRGAGPTISSLLHSSPSVPPVSPIRSAASNTSNQTTLSKLLESPPAMIHLPVTDTNSPTKNIIAATSRSPGGAPVSAAGGLSSPNPIVEQLSMAIEVASQLEKPQMVEKGEQQVEVVQSDERPAEVVQDQSAVNEIDLEEELVNVDDEKDDDKDDLKVTDSLLRNNGINILGEIKVEVEDLTPVILGDDLDAVENLDTEAEPMEVVVETADASSVNESLNESKPKSEIQDEVSVDDSENAHNQTGESDMLDDQLDHLAELDSHAVEMIVVGPNQSAVISVHHDGSNENLDDETSTTTSQSNVEDVIKEEMAEITSNKQESSAENKPNIVAGDQVKTMLTTVKTEKFEDETVNVENIVKDLEDVSPNEMKEIIEGAEVIVENTVLDRDTGRDVIVSEEQNEVNVNDTEDTSSSKDNPDKGDIIEVTTTTSTDSDSIVESVVDSVIEVGSTVVDETVVNNIIHVDQTTNVVEAREAEASNLSSVAHPVCKLDVDKFGKEQQPKSSDEDADDEPLPEPDSSSCSIDESESQISISVNSSVNILNVTAISSDEKAVDTNEAKRNMSEAMKGKGKHAMGEPMEIVTNEPSSSSNVNIALPPSTLEAITSSSRPDTPSTEEDNEPVANLVKRLPRKTSDSVPNSPVSSANEDGASLRTWKKSIMLVFNRLATQKFAYLFLKPITDEQAHGYHSVIHRPMDLSTIKKNIESGGLRTTVEFQRDMLIMFQNAIMYNNSTTLVYERASEMQKECLQHLQLMVEAMGEGVPMRRESLVVDKLTTRQRISLKQENAPEVPTKRKRMHAASISTSIDSPKRRKVEES